MIEAYAFFAMFAVQILAMSVVQPILFIRYCRAQAMTLPADRLAQLYPGVDFGLAQERFLTRYRALTGSVAVVGAVLLFWFMSYMRSAGWDASRVLVLAGIYFVVQLLPMLFVAWFGVRFNKVHRRPLAEGKRKALLQRRGLFDFVSPVSIVIALLSYLLFAALVIYVQTQQPVFARSVHPWMGYQLLAATTLAYILEALIAFAVLYSKGNSLVTHADRLHAIGRSVRSCVYGAIATVIFIASTYLLVLLDLDRWQPFALSACLVASAILSLTTLVSRPRDPQEHEPGADVQLTQSRL